MILFCGCSVVDILTGNSNRNRESTVRSRKEMLPSVLGERHQEKSDAQLSRKESLFVDLQVVPFTEAGNGRGMPDFSIVVGGGS